MFIIPAGGSSAVLGATTRSLRFNSADSSELVKVYGTPTVDGKWTFSAWVKRAQFSTAQTLLATASGSMSESLRFTASNTFAYYMDVVPGGGGDTLMAQTSALTSEPGEWLHVFVSRAAAGTSTVSLQVTRRSNGSSVTASVSAVQHGLGNSTLGGHFMGSMLGGSFANIYLSDVYWIDGQTLTPGDFAQTVSGEWVPKAFSGTYGNNGFHLDFANNSSTSSSGIGKDVSGRGNSWGSAGFSVAAGVANDSLVDVPFEVPITDTGVGGTVRGNYCTLDPTQVIGAFTVPTLTNGNLRAAISSAVNTVAVGTLTVPAAVATTLWLFEATLTASNGLSSTRLGVYSHTNAKFCSWALNGDIYINDVLSGGSHPSFAYTTGDVLGFGFRVSAGAVLMSLYRNGTELVGLGGGLTFGAWTPFVSLATSAGQWDLNFGARPFAYPPPSVLGYKTICSTNIP